MKNFFPVLLLMPNLAFALSKDAPAPTFSREVVRIFQHDCQGCHRAGGLAPFSLTDYTEAQKHASDIDDSVTNRSMPPWKPLGGCGDFVDDRSLSQADMDVIHQWAAAGAPEGNRSDMPPPLKFPDQWTLGQPDVALSSPVAYQVGATDEDEYRCFILPYEAAKDDYIVGLEVRPDNPSVVHHAIIYLDPKNEAAALVKPGDPQPGYECFGGPGYKDFTSVGGWVPGNDPFFQPEGMGFAVPKGSKVVMQIHFHRDGKTHSDRTLLGLHFAKSPITHPLYIGGVANKTDLHIPAGDSNFTISAEKTLPIDMQIVAVTPHMHLIGKKIGLEAILPDNSKQCLIQINDWDFHWQGTYRYKKFIDLPKGTKLRLTGTYNNSESNPDQFYHPPQDINWGERTTDEMFLSFFNFITK